MFCHLVSCSSIDSWQLAIPRLLISDFFTGQINTLSFSVSTAKTYHRGHRSTSWQEKEREYKLLASRQERVLVYTVSVLTGIDPCLHCIAGTLLTLRPSIALLNPGETGPLWSGLPPMYNNNIPPWRTKFTDKTKLLNIHIFLPLQEDFDGFAGIKLSFR